MIKHTTVALIGYDEKKPNGALTESTTFEIVAENYEQAKAVAEVLYKRPNYVFTGLVEAYRDENAPHYTVFFIACYDRHDPERGIFHEHTGLQILALNADEALERAKKIVQKPFYKITDILQK